MGPGRKKSIEEELSTWFGPRVKSSGHSGCVRRGFTARVRAVSESCYEPSDLPWYPQSKDELPPKNGADVTEAENTAWVECVLKPREAAKRATRLGERQARRQSLMAKFESGTFRKPDPERLWSPSKSVSY